MQDIKEVKTQQTQKPQTNEKPNIDQKAKHQKKIFTKGDHLFQIKHMLDAMISQSEEIPSECQNALMKARVVIWDSIKSREEGQMGIST